MCVALRRADLLCVTTSTHYLLAKKYILFLIFYWIKKPISTISSHYYDYNVHNNDQFLFQTFTHTIQQLYMCVSDIVNSNSSSSNSSNGNCSRAARWHQSTFLSFLQIALTVVPARLDVLEFFFHYVNDRLRSRLESDTEFCPDCFCTICKCRRATSFL